jgi:hypothetical protein
MDGHVLNYTGFQTSSTLSGGFFLTHILVNDHLSGGVMVREQSHAQAGS